MILPQPLNEQQRRASQLNFNRYNRINGASYACLGETVVILFAIKLHAPNFVIAALGAMIYFGFLMLPLGIIRMGQVGAARSQADFWVCRNVAALLTASAALIQLFNQELALGIILLGSFLFYGFRAAGVVMAYPLYGDITSEQDRARFLARTNALFYTFQLITLITISLILSWNDHLIVLVGIIIAGAIMGVTSTTFMRKIDESAEISVSAKQPLMPQLKEAYHDSALRQQIYAVFVLSVAVIMIASISIATVKRGYGVSDHHAVIFSLVNFAACVVGARLSSPLIKWIGTKNLALISYLIVFPICLFWAFSRPIQSPILFWIVFSIPFLLNGIYYSLCTNAMTNFFLQTVPIKRRVVSSMFVNLTSGVVASATGVLLAGLLLKFLEGWFGTGIEMFRVYFIITAVILIPGLYPILRLKTNVSKPSTSPDTSK